MSIDDKEQQEKHVKQLENAIKSYEEFQKEWVERAEEYRRRVDFVKGIVLGLTIGIMGNLFVQYFFEVFNAVLLEEHRFLWNVSWLIISLILILYVSTRYRTQLKEYERKVRVSIEGQENMKGAIERLEEILERERKR